RTHPPRLWSCPQDDGDLRLRRRPRGRKARGGGLLCEAGVRAQRNPGGSAPAPSAAAEHVSADRNRQVSPPILTHRTASLAVASFLPFLYPEFSCRGARNNAKSVFLQDEGGLAP